MSRYPDKASAVLLPTLVLAKNLLARVIPFGGFSPEDSIRPNIRGVVVALVRGLAWGVTR